jgi:adenylyltransferase/sulfurtransferase
MALSDEQLERYARHIVLKEVGGAGQAKLLNARVLVVGAGGLGSPLLLYLAAAGVGIIGIVDDDKVTLSNLQRQIVHETAAIGARKTESAARTLKRVNPEIRVIEHPERLVAANARALLRAYDIVADGSDNFATRFVVNDACFFEKKTLVSGAVAQFDGQVATFKPYASRPEGGHYPCYRCLYPESPPPDTAPPCAEAGILGALAGVVGTIQAVEVIKEIVGLGESLAGRLLIYDGLHARIRTVKLQSDASCALCGTRPTIRAVA